MSDRFIKYIPSEFTSFLRQYHTPLYLLLSLAAERARFQPGESALGLLPGDAILGSYEEAGISRQQYRDAIEKGESLGVWEVVFVPKSKKTKKRTIKGTIKAIVVNIKDTRTWDLNLKQENHQETICGTTAEPQTKNVKNVKKIDTDPGFSKIHSSKLNGIHEKFGISEGFKLNVVQATIKHLQGEDMEIGNPKLFLRKCFHNTNESYEFALSLHEKKSKNCSVHCGPDYLEFTLVANCPPKTLRLTGKNFIKEAKEMAKDLGVQV